MRQTVALGASLCAIVATSCSVLVIDKARLSLVEDFENGSSFSARLLGHRNVRAAPGRGTGGSNAVRVEYEGYPQGSRRVLANHPLPTGTLQATLVYRVRFCPGFQFVKGGKLHGLGPGNPVAGGNPVTAAQWSARVVFLDEGRIATYVYHQDLPGRYGDTVTAADFRFEPGRYYTVALYVRLNDPPAAANGRAELYVDGSRLVSHENIRFRAAGGDGTLIRTLLFHTFHGGHTIDYAPRRRDGTYTRECAYFDDLAVHPYFHVKATH